mmetsp:Transcript_5039/g.11094  ORF Transcript_5039/g.11094 Transcript_5039/m.11094 type:complete len:198 (-) Transcript_5039:124-717(-)
MKVLAQSGVDRRVAVCEGRGTVPTVLFAGFGALPHGLKTGFGHVVFFFFVIVVFFVSSFRAHPAAGGGGDEGSFYFGKHANLGRAAIDLSRVVGDATHFLFGRHDNDVQFLSQFLPVLLRLLASSDTDTSGRLFLQSIASKFKSPRTTFPVLYVDLDYSSLESNEAARSWRTKMISERHPQQLQEEEEARPVNVKQG